MEMTHDRSVMVTIKATVDPSVPDRMVITLTRHPINPTGEPNSETTPSVSAACRHVERWLSDFAAPTQDEMYL